MATLLAGGVIIAGWVLTKSDLWVFAGVTAVVITFGYNLVETFTILKGATNVFIAAIIVGPLLLMYLMAAMSFWRGRSD